jgi:hypothetical protein
MNKKFIFPIILLLLIGRVYYACVSPRWTGYFPVKAGIIIHPSDNQNYTDDHYIFEVGNDVTKTQDGDICRISKRFYLKEKIYTIRYIKCKNGISGYVEDHPYMDEYLKNK